MIAKKLDENRVEYYNNSDTSITYYEFHQTDEERTVVIKPWTKEIMFVKKPEVEESKEVFKENKVKSNKFDKKNNEESD